ARDPRRKHIKESLPQPIAGRPGSQSCWSIQRPSPQRSRNHPHRDSGYKKRSAALSHYNLNMRGWTIPLGRWMGVEMRIHVFFPGLALVCLGLSAASGVFRGLSLFFICVFAVAVRETARLIVAAYLNLKLRAVLLLPIG